MDGPGRPVRMSSVLTGHAESSSPYAQGEKEDENHDDDDDVVLRLWCGLGGGHRARGES